MFLHKKLLVRWKALNVIEKKTSGLPRAMDEVEG